MAHVRTQIRLDLRNDIMDFIKILNTASPSDNFVVENFDGTFRVNARSYLGLMYASVEFSAEGLFLVNTTNDGKIPFEIDKFRF